MRRTGSTFGQFNVNGQRALSNYITVDGVNAATTQVGIYNAGGTSAGFNVAGGTNSMVSVDALQEFRIVTSSFAPEFGRTPGGQVILQTRSGTNSLHGTLFEYVRNDKFDANNWFSNRAGEARAPERFNDFGGTLGGPIFRDKTFFFFSYEGQRLKQPQFGIGAVPSLAARQNSSPVTEPFLNGFPIPNGPDLSNGQARFTAGYSNPLNTDAASLRVDHVFGSKLRAFASYNYSPSNAQNRSNNSTYSLSDILVQDVNIKSLTLGATHIPTSNMVNEFRLNLSDNIWEQSFVTDDFGGATPPANSSFFIPGFSQNGEEAVVNLGYLGGRLARGPAGYNEQRQINLVDSATFTIGVHQLKTGADYRRILPYHGPQSVLSYSFGGVSGLANNLASSFFNISTPRVRPDLTNLSLYIQDSWRASPKLTLTYGIRWELNTPPRNRDSDNGNYIPLLGNYATGAVQVGQPGSELWSTKYSNFAPRIGLAYGFSRDTHWQTVVRAGAGLFYDIGIAEAAEVPWQAGFPGSLRTLLVRVPLPISAAQAALPSANFSNPAANSSFVVFPNDFALPRTWEWNLSLQQSLGVMQTVTLSYVAAAGRKLTYPTNYPSVGQNTYSVDYVDNSGTSDYESLQVQYQRRLSRGLSAAASYTWGHSLDTASTDAVIGIPTTYLTSRSNRGPSDFDVRHVLHGAMSYTLPAPHTKSGFTPVLEGWGLDAILTAQSAYPINVTGNIDVGFGSFAFRPDLINGVPIWITNSNVPGGRQLNPTAFVLPTGRQGTLGRNALRGFDLGQLDLSLRRSFHLKEPLNLVFRGDAFNIFNHPNFANPVSTLGTGTFGTATSMANASIGGQVYGLNSLFQIGGPRSLQLSLKLQF